MTELRSFKPNQSSEDNANNNDRYEKEGDTIKANGDQNGQEQAETKTIYTPGFYENISNADYHASGGVSSTELKTAINSMEKYRATLSGEIEFNTTATMKLGTAVHSLVLEPDNFYNDVAVSPEYPTGAAGKELKAEFELINENKTIIDREQFAIAKKMAASVMGHDEAMRILVNVECERSGYYIDRETELLCKYRPDIRSRHFIADLKTTTDASKEAFSRTIHRFGYHISAAHYLAGDTELHNTRHEQFVFIVVENKPPHQVAVYTLDDRSLTLGYKKRAEGLRAIRSAQDTGIYPLLNDGKAQSIGCPNWAFYED